MAETKAAERTVLKATMVRLTDRFRVYFRFQTGNSGEVTWWWQTLVDGVHVFSEPKFNEVIEAVGHAEAVLGGKAFLDEE